MRSRYLVSVGVAGACAVALVFWWLGRQSPERAVATERDPRPFIRLSVSRNAATGTIAIKDSAVVNTAAQLLTGQGGHYVVLDGPTGVLTAAPFTFPTDMVEEFGDGELTASREVRLASQDVMVFLPYSSDATGLRILDIHGETVAELAESVLRTHATTQIASATVTPWRALRSMIVPVTYAAAPADDLRAAFPHIFFPTNVSGLSVTHQGSVEQVEVLNDYWATALHEALDAMAASSPILLGSIASIAIVDFADGGASVISTCAGMIVGIRGASTVGNQIVINAKWFQPFSLPEDGNYELDFSRTTPQRVRQNLGHESAHAFSNLIDDESGNHEPNTETLPADVLEHVNAVRQMLSPWTEILSGTWRTLHNTATIASDVYGSYAGADYKCAYPTNSVAQAAGFASSYGAKNELEDFATHVELFYTPESPAICQLFNGLTDEIPRESVLAFAKLNLMLGLQVISETNYLQCVQNADPAKNEGFQIGNKNFTDDLKAGILKRPEEKDGSIFQGTRFAVMGKTDGLQAMIKLYSPPLVQLFDEEFPIETSAGLPVELAFDEETGEFANIFWRPANPVRFFKMSKTLGWLTPYLFGRVSKVGGRGYEGLNMITYQPTGNLSAIELTRKTRISADCASLDASLAPLVTCTSGAFVVMTSYTPTLKKGYAFFVRMDDWMGRSKRNKEETISDYAESEDEEGPIVFDLIWFHVKD